jgi:hypothetical protein
MATKSIDPEWYQMPTDPSNIQVAERIRQEGLAKLGKIATVGVCGARIRGQNVFPVAIRRNNPNFRAMAFPLLRIKSPSFPSFQPTNTPPQKKLRLAQKVLLQSVAGNTIQMYRYIRAERLAAVGR